jgi:hypothetical protein
MKIIYEEAVKSITMREMLSVEPLVYASLASSPAPHVPSLHTMGMPFVSSLGIFRERRGTAPSVRYCSLEVGKTEDKKSVNYIHGNLVSG